ncbi:MAG: lactate dehydrogenase [Spirochaetes bacterium DG_61]|nr:MAG: lactate dehydrogenase [Spirochaetes bacterium DG_61]
MEDHIVWIDFDIIEQFVIDVFRECGVPDADAKVCADVLLTADKRGIHSHGINRLKTVYYDRIKIGIMHPVTPFEIIREGPTSCVVEGHDGMGHVISKRSMDIAINKAKDYGMGMVVVKNSSHYGIAGYYVLMAVKADMIGISGTNARPAVAPTFGVETMLGTNPMTFGMPTDEPFPFLIDCATATTAEGKIEVYMKKGMEVPSSWVIGEDGRPRTDASQILKDLRKGRCAITPLGGIGEETAGYKGYGYSTVVEILCSALSGGKFLKMLDGVKDGKPSPYHLGHFFIAINISAFIDPGTFKKVTGDILRSLRASKKMPGQERIYTAGEKEYLYWESVKDKGIPLDEKLQKEIVTIRDELGLYQYDFPF